MEMYIENIPSFPIAYIRRAGIYGPENIKIMEQLKHWAKHNNLMDDKAVILGITHDNPQITPSENCRYDAGIILYDSSFTCDSSVQFGKTSGGKHAVFIIEHTATAMEQAWAKIFPVLSESCLFLDYSRPILERYATRQIEQHLCEICVPIF